MKFKVGDIITIDSEFTYLDVLFEISGFVKYPKKSRLYISAIPYLGRKPKLGIVIDSSQANLIQRPLQ